MMKILVVVDMQNDFVTGSLKNEAAQKIVLPMKSFIENFDGTVIYTRDTHSDDYLKTQEGHYLPIKHCIQGTWGHEIIDELNPHDSKIINKRSFGSEDLACYIDFLNEKNPVSEIHLVGVCTDICVIANAIIIKTHLPEVPIYVHKDLTAGVTASSHNNALCAMKSLQIEVI